MGWLCGEGIVKPTILAIRPHTTLAKHVVSDILSGGLLIGGSLINHYYGLESFQFPSPKNISWLSDCSLYIARLDCKGVPGRWIYHEIEFSTWDRKGLSHVLSCFHIFWSLFHMFHHFLCMFHHVSTSFRMFTPGHSKVALETPRTHPARCPLMSGHHRSLGDGYGS